MERVLFRFTKGEPVRFVGHLDLMRVVERAMRRSRFPVAYSQGFNPRPRMSFASALTLGATSAWELCQLDLAEDLDEARVAAAFQGLRSQLPEGLEVREVWPIPLEKRNPYIQVSAAEYHLVVVGEDAAGRLEGFLRDEAGFPAAVELRVETLVPEALLQGGSAGGMLVVKLPAGERAGVRIRDFVAEVEKALPGLRVVRLHRARLWCELDPAPEAALV